MLLGSIWCDEYHPPMGRPRTPAIERFWPKVRMTHTCWVWTASTRDGEYGQFRDDDQAKVFAHRWAYEWFVGPIPAGLTIDHLCRNPRCVNPAHLEPVTSKINTLRGNTLAAVNARLTACRRGHPFDAANTHVNARGSRVCLACNRERCRRNYARRKARA